MNKLAFALAALATFAMASTASRAADPVTAEQPQAQQAQTQPAFDYDARIQFLTEANMDDAVKALKLTGEDVARIKPVLQANKAALEAWDKDNAQALATAEQAFADARAADDANAMEATRDQAKNLRQGRQAMVFDNQNKALALLSPDQRLTWIAYRLDAEMQDYFRLAALTPDQLTVVNTLAGCLAKSLVNAPDADTVLAGWDSLTDAIRDVVLTDKQRDDLKASSHKKAGKAGKKHKKD